MLGTAGTFTSCKDYDDDITNLQEQITANADAIKALQEKIDAGKWITSISAIEGGFTVTFSDGQTFDIVNGAAGADGTEWTIGEDGYWYKDNVKTEYKAAISGETSKVVVPTIKDGYWYLVDEETGELVLTEYKANGAAYAVAEANGGFTIYMPNEDGTEVQEIYVPGAAGSITSMTAQLLNGATTFTVKEFLFNLTDEDRATWKALTGKDATTNKYILASADEIGLRINPVNVDASEIEFSLYNSKNEVLPYVTLLPTEYKEYVTATKAAYGNGLYTLAMERTEAKDKNALKALTDLLTTTGGNIAYAVSATTACRAEYNITVAEDDKVKANLNGININNKSFVENSKYSGTKEDPNVFTADSKATNVVTVGAPSDLYDMWLSVEDEDQNLFDIVFDQEKHTFVVNADPDVITKSYFDLTITTINNNGVLSETVVRINVSSKIAADPIYDKITHTIVANAKKGETEANFFTAEMATMTTALGSQLDAWKKNLASVDVKYYTDADCTKDEKDASAGIALTFTSADGKTSYTGNNIKNASLLKFTVTNATAVSNDFQVDKVYYAKVTFKNASGSELNSIVIPFEFKIPAVATFFEQKSAYVVDGVINAYFYQTATTDPAAAATTAVEFNKYFSKILPDATVSLVADEKINDKPTKDLFKFSSTITFKEATIDLIDGISGAGAGQNGYGQAVTVNATKDNYEGWKYQAKGANTYSFKIRLMSPIYEGTVVPAEGSTITISGNDLVKGALITDADIIGKDYNGNNYTVVPDLYVDGETADWANPQIEKVSAAQDADKYIKAIETVAATKAANGSTVNGGFKLTGESISNTVTVEMPVTVEDAWGYKRTVGVSVTITKN